MNINPLLRWYARFLQFGGIVLALAVLVLDRRWLDQTLGTPLLLAGVVLLLCLSIARWK